ncbi:MAG: hypothetical protein ACJA2S_005769 [Cyclobacteriaceae bacterium]|jgi:hypothetical protein
MKHYLLFLLVAIFSIFIGSQITEGVLLVPYWQSLSSNKFYAYYNEFGPLIGDFYSVLTITAALIPIGISIYCKSINSNALKYALISSILAILFVSSFYIYFKGTNELFYQAALNDIELKNELVIWNYWHWGRIIIECLSLVFLILASINIQKIKKDNS